MATFRTTDGADWTIAVNVGVIKRVIEDTGVRLTDIFASDAKVGEFFSDDVKFSEVIWSIVRPQADAKQKTADEFFSVINGAVIEQAAEAMLTEIVDFFQEPRRTLLRRVLDRFRAAQKRLVTAEYDAASRRLETMTDEQILVIEEKPQTPLSSATSSPGAAA
jgi:hypothetical protein